MVFNTYELTEDERRHVKTAVDRHTQQTGLPETIHACTKTEQLYHNLPQNIREQIQHVADGTLDHIILRNLPHPQSEELPETPGKLRTDHEPTLATALLAATATPLGTPSHKGIENTIRWQDNGTTKPETWHGHPRFNHSLFYTLRSDSNADVYLTTVEQVLNSADEEVREALITPHEYQGSDEPLPLLQPVESGYRFAPHLYRTPSDIEDEVDHLDLPDVKQRLHELNDKAKSEEAQRAIKHLLKQLVTDDDAITYRPGDLAIYDEQTTLRYSPSYETSQPSGEERWLRSVSTV